MQPSPKSLKMEKVEGKADGLSFLPFGQMKQTTRNFSFFIVGLLFFSGFATYFILLNMTSIVPTKEVVVTVLTINAILVIVMLIIILVQLRRLIVARSQRLAGAQIHTKLVLLFSAIAAFPLILMALFASFSLDNNLDHWFSKPIKEIVRSSLKVAQIYVLEKGTDLGSNTATMAKEFSSTKKIVKTNPKKYRQLLKFLAPIHNVEGAYIIDNLGNVLAAYHIQDKLEYEFPNQTTFNLANAGKPVVILPTHNNLPLQNTNIIFSISQNNNGIIHALVKLKNLKDTYLYTLSKLDKNITTHLVKTRSNVYRYNRLQKRKGGYQVAFALMYVVVAFTLLLAVIWVGFWFADKLVDPIRRLIAAAKKVSDGNLSATVSVSANQGELADLGEMFNNMTTRLRMQRNELTDATTLINERRRFTEAVLSGVTAGVIGLDDQKIITLVNRSAENLLPDMGLEEAQDKNLGDILPDFSTLVEQVERAQNNEVQDNIDIIIGTHERSFAVKITREQTAKKNYGYVITFDDITDLLSAQKTAAWADVAQRIAHEIKNPLTPIQLSAERLKRKYSKVIAEDDEVFAKCTGTIIRQVGDIGRMVSEFSDFAKISEPILLQDDVCMIVSDGMILFKMAHSNINFITDLPDQPLITLCDRSKLTQCVTNLVKNASEAIEARAEKEDKSKGYKGQIKISLSHDDRNFTLCIIDNGCGLPNDDDMGICIKDNEYGLPKEKRNKLFEPYITTRAKGTGLGLAIVKKVIEQHHGTISLNDAKDCGGEGQGTCVRIIIPLKMSDGKQSNKKLEEKPSVKIIGKSP